VPERINLRRFGEEAVAAEVESVPVALDRLGQPADLVLGLEHDDVAARLSEKVARGQTRRSAAENKRRGRNLVSHESRGRRTAAGTTIYPTRRYTNAWSSLK
jgi:hypothetical protein